MSRAKFAKNRQWLDVAVYAPPYEAVGEEIAGGEIEAVAAADREEGSESR